MSLSLYCHIGYNEEYQHDAGDFSNLIAPVTTITIALQDATESLVLHIWIVIKDLIVRLAEWVGVF
jgi:hypothetical protein